MIMANQVNKQHELTINISAQSRTNLITNTTFFSMDVETAKKIINFTHNNAPVDLTDTTVLLAFEFVGNGSSKIIDSTDGSLVITNPELGQCEVILPNHFYEYTGQVLIHAYIKFNDGRSLDAGVIMTEFEESWLDKELEEMTDFYVRRFENLAEELRDHAAKLKNELNHRMDDIQKRLNEVDDFRGPQGIQGIQGERGPQGIPGNLSGTLPWESVINRPTTFPPTSHAHTIDEIENLQDKFDKIFDESTLEHQINHDLTIENTRSGKLINRSLEGQTFVNLWSDRREDFINTFHANIRLNKNEVSETRNSHVNGATRHMDLDESIFVNGRRYTAMILVEESNRSVIGLEVRQNSGSTLNSQRLTRSIGNTLINFIADTGQNFRFRVAHNIEVDEAILNAEFRFKVLILEGDHSEEFMRNHMNLPPRKFVSVGDGVDEFGITTVGENLFDGAWVRGTFRNTDGRELEHQTVIRTGFIRILNQSLRVQSFENLPFTFHWFDKDKRQIGTNSARNNTNTAVPPANALYTRIRRSSDGVASPLDLSFSVAYDRISPDVPHQSTSTTIEYRGTDGEWKTLVLRSITVDGDVLLADEVTETEYIQRIVEVDLASAPLSATSADNLADGLSAYLIEIATSANAVVGFDARAVVCNKLPTINSNAVQMCRLAGARRHIQINLLTATVADISQLRRHLIDNNYQFLVPLAEPRKYPIRMRSLSSFEPVTNVQMSTGLVQPRFRFKIAQSLSERLCLAESKIRKLTELVQGLLNKSDGNNGFGH